MENTIESKEAGELDLATYQQENKEVLDQLIAADDGPCNKVASASTNMIRRRIRENGFFRKIIPTKTVSNEDLNRLPNTELPAIVEDMEADQPGAKSISFNDTPDTEFYRGDKPGWSVIYFCISGFRSCRLTQCVINKITQAAATYPRNFQIEFTAEALWLRE